MKKNLWKVAICIISCLLLCACRNKNTTAETEAVEAFDFSTENGFWKGFSSYREAALEIFYKFYYSKVVTEDDVEQLAKVQSYLDKLYKTARESSYYEDVAWFIDDELEVYNCLKVIRDNDISFHDDRITYSEEIFTISANSGLFAIFIQNADGPVAKDFYALGGTYDVARKYTILDKTRDTFILVRGVESDPIMYIIPASSSWQHYPLNLFSRLQFIIMDIILGLVAFLFFMHKYKNSKKMNDKLFQHIYHWCGIIPAIIMFIGGIIAIIYVLA